MSHKTTNILKGICLIFMFIHHFFTFPDWYLETISYPYLDYFASHFQMPFKICVCVFAFLTGYIFATKKRSFSYSFKKIINFLITYWLVCIPLIIIAYFIGNVEVNAKVIIDSLFGFDFTIMCFSWYVYFYITIMIALTIIDKYFSSSSLNIVVFGLILPYILITFLMRKTSIDYSYLNNVREFFPSVICGYFFCKTNLIEKINSFYANKNDFLIIFVCIVAASLAFVGKYYMPYFYKTNINADLLYAPVFSISVATLISKIKTPIYIYIYIKCWKQ